MKSNNNRFAIDICRFFFKLVNNLQVTGMHTIKSADSNYGIFKKR